MRVFSHRAAGHRRLVGGASIPGAPCEVKPEAHPAGGHAAGPPRRIESHRPHRPPNSQYHDNGAGKPLRERRFPGRREPMLRGSRASVSTPLPDLAGAQRLPFEDFSYLLELIAG